MKSQVNGLLKVALGVLSDYLAAYPHDKRDVVRDIERLSLLIKERGIGVFLLDLPALDGSLVRGLENSRLVVSGALSKKASKTILVPRLFRGLWLRIFDSVGNLKKDADPTAIFFLRQLLCLGKKVEMECSHGRTKAALKEYYHVEQIAQAPSENWNSDYLDCNIPVSFDDYRTSRLNKGGAQLCLFSDEEDVKVDHLAGVLRRLQDNFDAFSVAIGEFCPERFVQSVQRSYGRIGFRHGPGAVSDLTSKEFKYDFPTWSDKLGRIFPFGRFGTIGYSGDALSGDRHHLPQFPWDQPEMANSRRIGCGTIMVQPYDGSYPPYGSSPPRGGDGLHGRPHDPLDRGVHDSYRHSAHEPPSRLYAVPKTAKGPRLIAAEPTAHQWCQQFIKLFLEERLSGLFDDNFISFKNQELSQRLVVKASLDKSLATVDLSSASDRLTCRAIERAFRKNKSLLRALHATRTRWTKDSVSSTKSSNFFINKKFASQGTAVTFPVQSIFFLIVALTCCGFHARTPEDFFCNKRFCKSLGRYSDKVRVFGDDIIIPKHGYALLSEVLHLLGLKVNPEKTFSEGHFRESCGMDSYMGVNVTPIKTTKIEATGPKSRQSLIDYSNNLFKAGLWNAAAIVESMIPGWVRKNLPVIGIGSGGVGRFSFCGTSYDHLDSRYHRTLHRTEYRQYSIRSSSKRIPTNSLSGVLQYFSDAPGPTDKWVHGIPGRPKTSDGLRWEAPY